MKLSELIQDRIDLVTSLKNPYTRDWSSSNRNTMLDAKIEAYKEILNLINKVEVTLA